MEHSQRLRSLILNAPLFVLFTCAWASDRWPDLMVPALVVAFGAIVVEVAALILLGARRPRQDDRSCVEVAEPAAAAPASALPETASFESVDAWTAEMEVLARVAARYGRTSSPGLVMIDKSMGVFLATRHAHLARKRFAVRSNSFALGAVELQVQRSVSQLPTLPDWKIVPQGQEAFTIDAGAFEIEHFGGRTNIRVHDPERVTVEGAKRGSAVAGIQPELKPAQYN